MAASKGMSAKQRNNFAIVEAHSIEYITNMLGGHLLRALVGIRKSSVGRGCLTTVEVLSPQTIRDCGTTRLFNRDDTGQSVKVGIRYLGVLLLDWF